MMAATAPSSQIASQERHELLAQYLLGNPDHVAKSFYETIGAASVQIEDGSRVDMADAAAAFFARVATESSKSTGNGSFKPSDALLAFEQITGLLVPKSPSGDAGKGGNNSNGARSSKGTGDRISLKPIPGRYSITETQSSSETETPLGSITISTSTNTETRMLRFQLNHPMLQGFTEANGSCTWKAEDQAWHLKSTQSPSSATSTGPSFDLRFWVGFSKDAKYKIAYSLDGWLLSSSEGGARVEVKGMMTQDDGAATGETLKSCGGLITMVAGCWLWIKKPFTGAGNHNPLNEEDSQQIGLNDGGIDLEQGAADGMPQGNPNNLPQPDAQAEPRNAPSHAQQGGQDGDNNDSSLDYDADHSGNNSKENSSSSGGNNSNNSGDSSLDYNADHSGNNARDNGSSSGGNNSNNLSDNSGYKSGDISNSGDSSNGGSSDGSSGYSDDNNILTESMRRSKRFTKLKTNLALGSIDFARETAIANGQNVDVALQRLLMSRRGGIEDAEDHIWFRGLIEQRKKEWEWERAMDALDEHPAPGQGNWPHKKDDEDDGNGPSGWGLGPPDQPHHTSGYLGDRSASGGNTSYSSSDGGTSHGNSQEQAIPSRLVEQLLASNLATVLDTRDATASAIRSKLSTKVRQVVLETLPTKNVATGQWTTRDQSIDWDAVVKVELAKVPAKYQARGPVDFDEVQTDFLQALKVQAQSKLQSRLSPTFAQLDETVVDIAFKGADRAALMNSVLGEVIKTPLVADKLILQAQLVAYNVAADKKSSMGSVPTGAPAVMPITLDAVQLRNKVATLADEHRKQQLKIMDALANAIQTGQLDDAKNADTVARNLQISRTPMGAFTQPAPPNELAGISSWLLSMSAQMMSAQEKQKAQETKPTKPAPGQGNKAKPQPVQGSPGPGPRPVPGQVPVAVSAGGTGTVSSPKPVVVSPPTSTSTAPKVNNPVIDSGKPIGTNPQVQNDPIKSPISVNDPAKTIDPVKIVKPHTGSTPGRDNPIAGGGVGLPAGGGPTFTNDPHGVKATLALLNKKMEAGDFGPVDAGPGKPHVKPQVEFKKDGSSTSTFQYGFAPSSHPLHVIPKVMGTSET